MKKASIISAFLGTLIEVYDFTVFPFLIPVLTEVFFSSYTKSIALNFTILAYVTSYVIKPFSAIIFGCFIDRFGRKKVLLSTTLLMTFATSAIGLIPSNTIGIYSGVALIVFRIIQGLSISGEFTSAIIIAVEYGKKYPAFTGSLAFLGGSVGLLLANLSVFILLYLFSHEQMVQFAWRIPFLIGSVGCLILLLIRNKVDDPMQGMDLANSGFSNLIFTQKKELIETFIVSSLSASAFYITFVFMPTYLANLLKLHSHQQSILITLCALLPYIICLPIGGIIADRIGIKRQIKIASLLYLLFAYLVFAVIPNLEINLCIIVLVFFAILQAFLNSALPRFIVTQFQKNLRGKALAISYNISLTLFAGLMPYLIISSRNELNPGLLISLCAALSLIVSNFKGKKYDYLRSKLIN